MKHEVLKTMVTLATTAFGLVAALAWNSAIQELFKQVFGKTSGLWSMFGYAVIVTVIAVIVTTQLGKMVAKEDAEPKT